VKAAVLYAAMSGDEQKNYEAIRQWSGQTAGWRSLTFRRSALIASRLCTSFENITSALSIHHGTADATVPVDWSVRTCDQLTSLGKNVQCTYYQDMPHTFYGAERNLCKTRWVFNQYLTGP
jgi:dienelactone hydrolase